MIRIGLRKYVSLFLIDVGKYGVLAIFPQIPFSPNISYKIPEIVEYMPSGASWGI